MKEVRIYLGCDLFIEGQRWQAKQVQEAIEAHFGERVAIYNPADNLSINDKSSFASGVTILNADYDRLKQSHILIALFDTLDVGLAVECGIAFERGIDIFQLHSDIRLGGTDNSNKIDALQRDIFENDFFYINKLLTATAYVDREGIAFETPRIYRERTQLVDAVIRHIEQLLD